MSAFQNVCPTRHEHILFRIKNAVLDDKQADDLLHFFILGETLILGFYRDWAHQSPFIYRIYICVLYYIYTSCTSTFNTLLLIHIHQVQPERRSTEGIEHFPFEENNPDLECLLPFPSSFPEQRNTACFIPLTPQQ